MAYYAALLMLNAMLC